MNQYIHSLLSRSVHRVLFDFLHRQIIFIHYVKCVIFLMRLRVHDTSSPALLFVNKIVRFFKCVNLRHKAPLRESWPFFFVLSLTQFQKTFLLLCLRGENLVRETQVHAYYRYRCLLLRKKKPFFCVQESTV